MYPDRKTAERELEIAGKLNPGLWTKHSENVAKAAEIIAEKCGENAEKAYINKVAIRTPLFNRAPTGR